MKNFRVTLERVIPGQLGRNPFSSFRTAESFGDTKLRVLTRTWEFEAEDRADVIRLFNEAKSEGIEQVKGFQIRTIEEL